MVRADPGAALKLGRTCKSRKPSHPRPFPKNLRAGHPRHHDPRQVLWLAAPVFVEQSLLYLIGLSDTILAGRYLLAEHLAGVTVASYLLWFLATLFTIGSIGGTALVARSIGAGRTEDAARYCGQAMALGVGLGLLALVLVQVLAPAIVAAMNLTGLAAESAARFLRIVGAVTPLLACTTVGNACLRGAGDTRTGMKVMVLMNAVNIGLTWLLALGWGPFPALGLTGIAMGTACGEGIGGAVDPWPFDPRPVGAALTSRNITPEPGANGPSLAGQPAGGGGEPDQRVMPALVPTPHQPPGARGDRGSRGRDPVRGDRVPVDHRLLGGRQHAHRPVSGRRRPDLAAKSARTCWGLGGLLLSFIGLMLFTQGQAMFQLFLAGRQNAVLDEGVPVLRIVALAMPALATISVLNGSLNGAGDTRWPWAITLTGYLLVRIPLTYASDRPARAGRLGPGPARCLDGDVRRPLGPGGLSSPGDF